jgi:hypothetical protein
LSQGVSDAVLHTFAGALALAQLTATPLDARSTNVNDLMEVRCGFIIIEAPDAFYKPESRRDSFNGFSGIATLAISASAM